MHDLTFGRSKDTSHLFSKIDIDNASIDLFLRIKTAKENSKREPASLLNIVSFNRI